MKNLVAVAVVSMALGLNGCLASAQDASAPKKAPHFTIKDSTGKVIKLSDFKGHIVVLEWTNPDCPFVQRHYRAGTMTALAKDYAPKGVVWLAINSTYGTTAEKNSQWVEKNHLPYPLLDDPIGTVGRLYSAKNTPDMFVIDAAGNIVYQGAIDNDPLGDKAEGRINYVEKALNALLAGKPVEIPETKPYGCSVKYPPEPK